MFSKNKEQHSPFSFKQQIDLRHSSPKASLWIKNVSHRSSVVFFLTFDRVYKNSQLSWRPKVVISVKPQLSYECPQTR